MIRDDDLRSSIDYSEGQKEAAHRILVELVNIFGEYKDDIRIVGGWVPDLMFPGEGHIGSVDVDVLINHLTLQDEGYQNMSRILQNTDTLRQIITLEIVIKIFTVMYRLILTKKFIIIILGPIIIGKTV